MGKCVFVTGTGTDIGKTYVSGLIVKKIKDSGNSASYYKAVLSGADVHNNELLPGDVLQVKKMADLSEDAGDMISYVFKEVASPHLAARAAHCLVNVQKII